MKDLSGNPVKINAFVQTWKYILILKEKTDEILEINSLKSKDLKPKLSEERDQTNNYLLDRFTLEEKVLLKRLLRDMQK